jgi:UDP-2,3-diacylglucosamine hydrolase
LVKDKIYFASDFHLGVPSYEESLAREKLICSWLDNIKNDAAEIYLVGDIFDFWFEHKYTAPKGYVRLLGKLAELSDSGIKLHLFTGNHDMWMKDYLQKELNAELYFSPITKIFNDKIFFIGHGDGLGPGDKKYKFLKKFFASKICQWLFARLHPNLSFSIANFFSRKSRLATGKNDEKFLGLENEWLYIFCKDYVTENNVDYFIFGHRHLPLELKIGEKATYINLGEWLNYQTFAEFDGDKVHLRTFSL